MVHKLFGIPGFNLGHSHSTTVLFQPEMTLQKEWKKIFSFPKSLGMDSIRTSIQWESFDISWATLIQGEKLIITIFLLLLKRLVLEIL